jgi:hypothetical protein
VASPNPDYDESCEFVYVRGSFVHQKCFNYAQTNLLFNLCRSLWIFDPLVTCPGPHPGVLAHPFTFEVMWIREHTPTHSVVFIFRLTFESFKECGVCHQISFARICRGPWNESFACHFRFKRCPCWEGIFLNIHLLPLLYNMGHLPTSLDKKVISRLGFKEFLMRCWKQFIIYIWMLVRFNKMKNYLKKIAKETCIKIDPQRLIGWDLCKINKHIM